MPVGDQSVPRGVRLASEWAARLLIIGIGVVALTRVIGTLSEVVVPIVVAVLLAALLMPVKHWLGRFMPGGAAAGVTVLGTLAVISALFTLIGTQFSSGFNDLTDQVAQGIRQIRDWVNQTFHISDDQLDEYFTTIKQSIQKGNFNDTATAAGLTATHFVAGLFIALFALFFFLFDGAAIWSWVVRLFPRATRDRVHSSGVIAWGQLSAFTRATVIVAAVDALGISIGAAILGVPFAVAIGLLVFIGAFIPIIGAAISGSVAVLLALVALGPVKALIMIGVVIGVQQLESLVLQPFLLGRAVRVHPLAVILAIAAGVVLGGIIGALVAVPLAAVANAVGHHLLSEDPEETDAAVLTDDEENAEESAAAE
jgi:predicted PurR-regulated permease PerM